MEITNTYQTQKEANQAVENYINQEIEETGTHQHRYLVRLSRDKLAGDEYVLYREEY